MSALRKQTAGIFIDAFGLKCQSGIASDQRFDFGKFLKEFVDPLYTPMAKNVYLGVENQATQGFVKVLHSYTYNTCVHKHWYTWLVHDLTICLPSCEVVIVACAAPGIEPLLRVYAERGVKFFFLGLYDQSFLSLPGAEVLSVNNYLRPARSVKAQK